MRILLRNYFYFAIICSVFAAVFLNSNQAFSQNFPEKPASFKLVNDFAKIYSQEQSGVLEEKLDAYNNKTSTQIAVVTITSLGGYPIDDYTIKLANKWQIGQKGKNNGLLILIAKDDHKIFIASGYGMEGVLNDGKIGTIIRTKMVPQFKKGDYYAATNDGIDAMIAAAGGEYVNDKINRGEKDASFFAQVVMYLILFLVLMFMAYNRSGVSSVPYSGGIYYGNRRGGGGSGGGGFGGGSFGGGGAGGSW